MMAPVAYGVKDAAAVLGLSRATIYNMINAGTLRKVKIGRRSLIPASDIAALIPGVAA